MKFSLKTMFEFPVFFVAGWLGAMSTAVALLLSPVTIAFCRRKSTRVTAVVGGLITALGCLFTSFASQFHQLFFSYGTVIGKKFVNYGNGWKKVFLNYSVFLISYSTQL